MRRKAFSLIVIAALAVFSLTPGIAAAGTAKNTPVVLFPAFHLTKLNVLVHDQHSDPGCPLSGDFQDWYQNNQQSAFSQVCQDELETLRYNGSGRFSEQPGVRISVMNYGSTRSAPFYEPMYRKLESAGYTRDKNIVVAGYDSRLTPDLGGFFSRAKQLVERTYRINGNQPVQLVGHSNGPLYAQYLLTHTSLAWRHKYIHGFTPIAGNFPGQGSLYSALFNGLNVRDFGYPKTQANARSSARMYLTAPSTYLSSADPKVFGDRETVIVDRSTGRGYTPKDYPRLFADAKLPLAEELARRYIGFVKSRTPADFPYVDVHAEKGSGVSTMIGSSLPDLRVGQPADPSKVITTTGDGNQEDITNTAVTVWRAMPCFHFSLTDNPGVDHFSLPGNPGVLSRLLSTLRAPRSAC